MDSQKPHAPATERNREPILGVLKRCFADCRSVLEIGSGTGQHAVYFAAAMPWLSWQCSELPEGLPGIRGWLADAGLPNTPPPIALDVAGDWPAGRRYDALFSANTLHIMGWDEVERMFAGLGDVLEDDATVVVYGPFNYQGRYTSDSNAAFDDWLKQADPRRGIRDVEAVLALAESIGLRLVKDAAMPANNRCLVWRRSGGDMGRPAR